jgi:hypothetical protein
MVTLDVELASGYCGDSCTSAALCMAQQDDSHLDGIIDAAMEIAAERAAIMREMRQVLLADRLRDALLCACKLVGIEPTPAIDRLEDPQTGRASEASCHVM